MTDHQDDPPPPPDFTPVPLKHYRHDGWTPERQRAFIEALARCGSVPNAARSVGMGSARIYDLRNKPGAEEFSAAWNDALAKATNRVHDVLVDHAVNGAPEPIMFAGRQVGEFRRYNYRLMMWLLSHHKPDQFSLDADSAPALTSQRMKSLKKQWQAEWEAERKQEGETAIEEYQKAKDESAKKHAAEFDAKIENLRQRMIAAYLTDDPATGEPPRQFNPERASPMELLVFSQACRKVAADGADGED